MFWAMKLETKKDIPYLIIRIEEPVRGLAQLQLQQILFFLLGVLPVG